MTNREIGAFLRFIGIAWCAVFLGVFIFAHGGPILGIAFLGALVHLIGRMHL